MAANRDWRSWRIFRGPLAIAAVSLAGLIGALLVDGATDLLWNAMVALPLLAIAIFWARRSRTSPRGDGRG